MNHLLTIPLLIALLISAGCQRNPESGSIVVFAAASTAGIVTPIARQFEREHHISVRCSFGASSTLARQIESATGRPPASIFISAHPRWMDELAAKNLIEKDSRRTFMTNRLAIVVPRDADLDIDIKSVRMAMGDPDHVPAGMYARQALNAKGWWDTLKPRLIYAANARAALRYVETGQADAGIIYATDAASSSHIKTVMILPPDLHDPIIYEAALVSGANDTAYLFLASLLQGAAPESPGSSAAIAETHSDWPVIVLSLKVALWCMGITLLPGIALGWVLARKDFVGKTLVDALVHLPLVLPPVVVGYLLLVGLGRRGLVDLDIAFTWRAAVAASAVMGFPLMVRAVRLAIELVDRRLEQAAATLGAGPWRVFMTITLPLSLPGVLTGMVLAFARSLGEFGATMTFAANIPEQTRTLPLAVYTAIQSPGGDAQAARLVVISIALSLAALVISELLARRIRKVVQG